MLILYDSKLISLSMIQNLAYLVLLVMRYDLKSLQLLQSCIFPVPLGNYMMSVNDAY